MEGALEQLFGSGARIKIIRLFLLNSIDFFTSGEISRRCKVTTGTVRREIFLLKKIGFLKEKPERIDEIIKLRNGKIKNRKKMIQGISLDLSFPLLLPLKNLVVNSAPVSRDSVIKKISKTGKIKMIILSGVFIQNDNSRIDVMVVGDSLNRGAIDRIIKWIESEVGKELSYAVFTTQDFAYRLSLRDKFIRDVLDYPHEKILNKLGVE
jgi:hypothetical protein